MNRLNELIQELCPDGVEYKQINELGIIFKGMSGVSNKWAENGNCQFIDYKNVYNHIKVDVSNLPFATVKKLERQFVLNTGDILFTSASETPDECAISSVIENNIAEGIFLDDHLFGIRLNAQICNSSFFNYYFRSKGFRNLVNKTVRGVTRFYISMPDFAKIVIPVPPLEIQCEIVRILDDYTEQVEQLKSELNAELNARKKQYEYYRELLIKNSADNFVKLSNIVDIYLGLTATPNYVEKGVTFISAQNTSSDYLDLTNVKYISEEEYKKTTTNAKPKKGDVLFTRVGSNLGHPVIVETDEKLCIFVSLGFLRPKDERAYNKFLKYWMNTDLFWEQVRKNVHGAAKINLNTGWLKDFIIPLPPTEEQERIVSILDRYDKLYTEISNSLQSEIEARQKQYEYYRDKLLSFGAVN